MELNNFSHRRFNPLKKEWVQVSPNRTDRPWQGKSEKLEKEHSLSHDPNCYLCPETVRANGTRNPNYSSTYAFSNDFASLKEEIPNIEYNEGLLIAKSEKGLCRVICFSPKHDLTMPEMSIDQIADVVDKWISECNEIGSKSSINHIQIFENKGKIMGCSNPHPHGQIWAQETVPDETQKKHLAQREYYLEQGNTLLSDYVKQELEIDQRVVFNNEYFVVIVPFWAVWPFETMIVPKRQMTKIVEMNIEEIKSFSEAIRVLTIKYDNLFETSFPYTSGIHQAPYNSESNNFWHWHMSFFPPLLRSATIKKFMVGYEMFANAQRDITPEFAAEKLRKVSNIHYKQL